ncbi:uncharacterized protein LOC131078378 isoform X3 [Cryptomeria japonica]|uniref:uncharacterized protein LOC131078378 isoform X3 n=1 Tax=Cryptomeria japonica TaxID=3369 RepID=UPI0025ACD14C|nr:uncharacterized protein LOC131078378 isoform X3 [Cryptomeria japonica]
MQFIQNEAELFMERRVQLGHRPGAGQNRGCRQQWLCTSPRFCFGNARRAIGASAHRDSRKRENVQSNKVRSIAGRIAVRAAERGWRVYLQNEYGTSADALDLMINIGKNKRARHEKIDAYAAVILLKRYFEMAGSEAELVWPKDTALQEKIRQRKAMSLFDDEDGFDYFTL